jgi:putative colanic acid biosynthesis acetyltransferase WcaF
MDSKASQPNESRPEVDLGRFSSAGFDRGASRLKEGLWLLVRTLFFELLPGRWYGLRAALLRLFGAKIGKHLVIRTGVRINMPWRLTLGDHVWIAGDCWLLNLAPIVIEDHVALSQRVFLCTGSHDYKARDFGLLTAPITVRRGAWLTAGTFVAPGVTVGSHAVLTMGSVATKDLEPYGIYRGNPAEKIRTRTIAEEW